MKILPSQETVHVREFVNYSFCNGLNNPFLIVVSCDDTYMLNTVKKLNYTVVDVTTLTLTSTLTN